MLSWRKQGGFSYVELLVAASVLFVLAMTAIPLKHWDDKRRREKRLKVTLQLIRSAIDQYNKYASEGLIVMEDVEQCGYNADLSTCYPKDLEDLVEGIEIGDPESPEAQILTFLQEIPIDPITELPEWGLRSYQDDHDATGWGGENVYDVYSLSDMQALDGTYYQDW